ncbi:MAG: hypothetical protein VZR35_03925 [Lachnospiraceae bacterium]|jgi:hypothetical protein|nr:hypothetical protein [Lachnospiraceae bacterium]MBR7014904.1 hypothetical protein [Lachnospiraceae bacterium]MEE3377606.1 hypothetical protein [Lachnospiraceae bacterium]
MSDDYADILNLPRPEPARHKRMPAENRAAQFMPFAALTGYEDAIGKTAEQVRERAELEGDLFAEEGKIYD